MSDERQMGRRSWMLILLAGFFGFVVTLLLCVPFVSYLLSPVLKKVSYLQWVSLGSADAFPEGQTRLATFRNPYHHSWDGMSDKTACWVRNNGNGEFVVFAINCAHLGCPVRWFPQSRLFMCPCHGGVYYADGSRAAGPPPRGLFKYPNYVKKGELMIHAGQLPTLSTRA